MIGGVKAQNLYDLMKKVTLIALMNDIFHKNLTNYCTQEYLGMIVLVPSTKMPLFKLIILRSFIQSTINMQQMNQSRFIQEFLLYKSLSYLSELEFLKFKII